MRRIFHRTNGGSTEIVENRTSRCTKQHKIFWNGSSSSCHKYCPNCHAHRHSGGDFRSKEGCKKCGGNNHTLLHMHEELRSDPTVASMPPPTRKAGQHAAPRPMSLSRSPSRATVANDRSAAEEKCPYPADSHCCAGHGLEDLLGRRMIDPCSVCPPLGWETSRLAYYPHPLFYSLLVA